MKHGKILFTAEEIQKKVNELGSSITQDYQNKELLLINVLKGGVIFLADLMRSINLPLSIDFMAISSYGVITESSGIVKIIKDLEQSIENKNVLIIEDIIDTGLTLSYLIRNLESRNPSSIEVCALLDRTVRRIIDIPIHYKGFDLADVFVVGYGLDYAQKYRNLPYIAEFEI
ncbi:MAG: hypoxanthine phosphoribosyltransferase [Actinobacteria bacterium]|nr:hypoxanthine phosphoribosyltransferase [Actinomycetota bacterium]